MADPLSTASGIIALIQLTSTVLIYLRDVKDASKGCKRLILEISSIRGILVTLRETVEDAETSDESWSKTIRSLGDTGGPLERLTTAIAELASKLEGVASASGLKKFTKSLRWPFQQKEAGKIIGIIERQKSLLSLALGNDHVALSKAIWDETQAIHEDVKQLRQDVQQGNKGIVAMQSHQHDAETQKKIAWLSPLNFWSKHNDISRSRQEGTGTWLLQDPQFKDWIAGNGRTLLCTGMPGAGKTVLSSVVIDHLHSVFPDNSVGIAWFFCNYKEQAQSVGNILGSILQQLLERSLGDMREVKASYKSHEYRHTLPSVGEYTNLLHSSIEGFQKVFIVADALDECKNTEGRRDTLLKVLRSLPSNVHFFATSRMVASVEQHFDNALHREIEATDADIEKYAKSRIANESRLAKHVKGEKSLEHTIKTTIVEKSRGMFLLAKLHMDSLAKVHSKRLLREALSQLPKELDDTYDDALRRIDSQDEEDVALARRVLSWICFASEPLAVQQLRYALAIQPGDAEIDEEGCVDEELFVSVCAGLVVIESESQIVRLVHYTTQEYFERHQAERFPGAEPDIARTCLTFLLSNTFVKMFTEYGRPYVAVHYALASVHGKDRFEPAEGLHPHQLGRYAVLHVWEHVCAASNLDVLEMAKELWSDDEKLKSFLLALRDLQMGDLSLPWHITFEVKLHFAIRLRLAEIAEWLIESGADPNSTKFYDKGQTALTFAAEQGADVVVPVLLKKGANINALETSWKGDSVWPLDGYVGQTPLDIAIHHVHLSTVEVLLRNGAANLNLDDYPDCEHQILPPLFFAVVSQNESMLEFLVGKGANVNITDPEGNTALHLAVEGLFYPMVALLLRKGLDVNARNESGETPVDRIIKIDLVKYRSKNLTETDSAKIICLLCEAGAVVKRTPGGQGPLYQAVTLGKPASVKVFRDHGARLEALFKQESAVALLGEYLRGLQVYLEEPDYYGPPKLLKPADWYDSAEELACLLLQTSKITVQDFYRSDILELIVLVGLERTLRLVLKMYGREVGRHNNKQRALQKAVINGSLTMTTLLLESGADPGHPLLGLNKSPSSSSDLPTPDSSKEPECCSLLCAPCSMGRSDIVRLLLDRNMDPNINCPRRLHGTPLCIAAKSNEESSLETVRLLLDAGAEVNKVPNIYSLPLYEAIADSHNADHISSVKKTRLLLERGADPNLALGSNGYTPLIRAASCNSPLSRELIELLLDFGADINTLNGFQGAALSTAADSHNESTIEVLQLLLERGADPGVEGGYYGGPLMCAVKSSTSLNDDAVKKVRLLLDAGAGTSATGKDRLSARGEDNVLLAAVQRFNFSVVMLLLEHGADVNVEIEGTEYGSVLVAACSLHGSHWNPAEFEALLAVGADPNKPAKNGSEGTLSPLMAALEGSGWGSMLSYGLGDGPIDRLTLLLKYGADINAQVGNFGTLLHRAISEDYKSKPKMLKFLVDNGADVNAIDSEGRSILSIAIEQFKLAFLSVVVHEAAALKDEQLRQYFESPNLELQGMHGLQRGSRRQYEKIRTLLKYGARPSEADEKMLKLLAWYDTEFADIEAANDRFVCGVQTKDVYTTYWEAGQTKIREVMEAFRMAEEPEWAYDFDGGPIGGRA